MWICLGQCGWNNLAKPCDEYRFIDRNRRCWNRGQYPRVLKTAQETQDGFEPPQSTITQTQTLRI
jgi:hypothetical protein